MLIVVTTGVMQCEIIGASHLKETRDRAIKLEALGTMPLGQERFRWRLCADENAHALS